MSFRQQEIFNNASFCVIKSGLYVTSATTEWDRMYEYS